MDQVEAQERGQKAQALLDNPLLKEAFAELQARYIQDLIQAPVGDLTATTAHASMKVLEDVKSHLKSIITTEKMASKVRPR